MNHIADTCPLKKFEGGLNLLHEADDDAVMWLESSHMTALLHSRNKQIIQDNWAKQAILA